MFSQSNVVSYLKLFSIILYFGYLESQITSGYGDQCDRMRDEWPMLRDHILGLRNDNDDMPRVKRDLLELRIRINDLENRLAHCACPVKGKPIFSSKVDGMDLGAVLDKAIRFYSTLRSGPHDTLYPSTPFPQAQVDLYDRDVRNNSLTGGWRDPDDGIKYTGPIAWTTTMMIWGLIRYEHAYKLSMAYDYSISNIKWSLEYLMKMYKTGQIYSQVGGCKSKKAYHTLWESAYQRFHVAHSIAASDDLADVSAAFAAASILFKKMDKAYSRDLLEVAIDINALAWKLKMPTSDPIVLYKYPRREYEYSFYDELTWSSLWLYRATKSDKYFDAFKNGIEDLVEHTIAESVQFNCTSKLPGILVILSELAQEKDKNIAPHIDSIHHFINKWMEYSDWDTSPLGLQCMHGYGTLPNSANNGFLMLIAIETKALDIELYGSITMQLSYVLGYNISSSVVGIGNDYPKRTRHFVMQCPFYQNYPSENASSCNLNYTGHNAFADFGALINGPDCDEKDSTHKPRTHLSNTVSAVNNAVFPSLVAGIITFSQITDAISMEIFDAGFYGYKGNLKVPKLPYTRNVHVL